MNPNRFSVNCGRLSVEGKDGWLRFGGAFVDRLALEQLSDAELVRSAVSGNGKSSEVIVRRYQKLVYNVLYQMLQDHEAAADATQETFIRAFKSLSTFRLDASFKPWLLRIATNCGINLMRAERSREHDSLEASLETSPGVEPASTQNVEQEIEWKFSQAMIIDALKELPARHRHVFLLRYQQDLSYADIASIMNEPETTIKALLHRVREILRKRLGQAMKDDENEVR